MKALISTYDKQGITSLAQALVDAGFDLVSTGGTHRDLTAAGLKVQLVSELTGFPEILDGRVKTLHPTVHAGLLARRDVADDLSELAFHDIDQIDIVVANLYPFVETIRKTGTSEAEALENIDIGGPTMLRAAAKNFPGVIVLVDPNDYEWVSKRINEAKAPPSASMLSYDERKDLAMKAFQHVAHYDTAVSRYLSDGDLLTPKELTIGLNKVSELRYGENPHQHASIYADPTGSAGIVGAELVHGIEMSYTNYLDADAAWMAVSDFSEPAACVVKHLNPCGLALHNDQPTAYQRAFQGDSTSAYGGIVAFNRPLSLSTVEAMRGVLYHIIIAPGFEEGVLEALQGRKQTRVLKVSAVSSSLTGFEMRFLSGGALLQTADSIQEETDDWEFVTKRSPTDEELLDLAFAWQVSRHIKSNAIVLARDNTMVGMGAGQPNRVTSVHLALRIAGDKAQGSAMASDAFMPFADNVELAATGGVTSVVQPGGSVRDSDVIEAADRLGMAMALTGVRHFKH